MFIGKSKGFGQRFDPPEPSPYLARLAPYCANFQRSWISLALIRDDIRRNVTNLDARQPTDLLFKEAMRRTIRAFALPERVKMLHLNDVFQKELPIWSSSPGLPWTQIGYKTKADIRKDPDAVRRVRKFWHKVKAGEKIEFPDCCAFIRAHIASKGTTKVRAVWGYPATVTFGEAVFALPLIEAYRKGGYPIAYGFETGLGGMKKIYHRFKGESFLGIDFKCFDKTLPPWLIEMAFDILAYNIDFTEYQDHGVARPEAMIMMLDRIRNYCVNTKIRMCNGERYMKDHGLASGSYFTQLVGSVCNYLLLQYATLRSGVVINDILVLGDDSIISTNKKCTPAEIADILEPLGLVVNVEKSGYSRRICDLSFLGFRINDGIPSRDRAKVFAALVFPERPDDGWDRVASRALGILYANFGVDPIVDFWTREIVNFQPFDLVLSRDQRRFLDLLGVERLKSVDPPTIFDLSHRIGYL